MCINEDKHCQLVEGQEGGWEEAQLWCEALLGAADFPQLQEADAGRSILHSSIPADGKINKIPGKDEEQTLE